MCVMYLSSGASIRNCVLTLTASSHYSQEEIPSRQQAYHKVCSLMHIYTIIDEHFPPQAQFNSQRTH